MPSIVLCISSGQQMHFGMHATPGPVCQRRGSPALGACDGALHSEGRRQGGGRPLACILAGQRGHHHVGGVQGVDEVGREGAALFGRIGRRAGAPSGCAPSAAPSRLTGRPAQHSAHVVSSSARFAFSACQHQCLSQAHLLQHRPDQLVVLRTTAPASGPAGGEPTSTVLGVCQNRALMSG